MRYLTAVALAFLFAIPIVAVYVNLNSTEIVTLVTINTFNPAKTSSTNVSTVVFPSTIYALSDMLLVTMLTVAWITTLVAYKVERNILLLLLAGAILTLEGLGLIVSRSTIIVNATVVNDTLVYHYDVNPYARVYIAGILYGIATLGIWTLEYMKTLIPRRRRWR